ncbi:MAG: UDP-N-acetylglucosamine 2-epimerase [Bacillota bacterium]
MKIAIVTGSRADYGLLYPLIIELQKDDIFKVSLIVTGMHLSKEHGYTLDNIKRDGIKIEYTVDLEQQGDSTMDVSRAISKGIEGFSNVFEHNPFDLVLILGDRYELWSVCLAAVLYHIPIAHIHGGEATEGAMDEYIRHSITKLSAIHFPSIKIYGDRIIQMGENPNRVHVVGALGIDNIKNTELMSIYELSEHLNFDFSNNQVALLTYHPVTMEDYAESAKQITEILEAVSKTQLKALVTMPNSDMGGLEIYKKIQTYTTNMPEKFILLKNLGQKAYLSAMKHSKLMIGNSSSGIIESASFKLPVVNIGTRQAGRLKPVNVVDCSCEEESIAEAINYALSDEFYSKIQSIENPYGDGNTAKKIVNILRQYACYDKKELVLKKFYNISIGK